MYYVLYNIYTFVYGNSYLSKDIIRNFLSDESFGFLNISDAFLRLFQELNTNGLVAKRLVNMNIHVICTYSNQFP